MSTTLPDRPGTPAPDPVIRVGIGLVGRRGMYLIRRRPDLPGSPMPGVWEFPGGKCEPGESPAAAVLRECREETGAGIVVGPLRRTITHQYPHGRVELHYFDCTLEDPHTEPAPGSGFLWVSARELPALTFPEANQPVLDELARLADRGGADGGDRSDPLADLSARERSGGAGPSAG